MGTYNSLAMWVCVGGGGTWTKDTEEVGKVKFNVEQPITQPLHTAYGNS